MELFQNAALGFMVVAITLFGAIKKVPVFDCFIEGAKKGIKTAFDILPSLTALMVAVSMLDASGMLGLLTDFTAPFFTFLGIPREVIPLCFMCPLSGSGATAMLTKILGTYGADGVIGKTASVICGASETTFYAVAVYYSSVGITKTRHTLPCALTCDFVSYITAAWCVRIFY